MITSMYHRSGLYESELSEEEFFDTPESAGVKSKTKVSRLIVVISVTHQSTDQPMPVTFNPDPPRLTDQQRTNNARLLGEKNMRETVETCSPSLCPSLQWTPNPRFKNSLKIDENWNLKYTRNGFVP